MIITEIVRMKTVEGITKDEFIGIVDGLERNFHSRQKGFIDTELLYHDEENEWYMIQHWNSKDDLKQASKKIFKDKDAEDFVKSLDKQSVKMLILPKIATWANTL
ncbi:antibiotic biosynthesis monooxygenase [Lacrimispora sp. 38-1]|uniref:antibiotic biosynthesis monooxygenase n=1 Tax=Lacrimispora sp. 38-1 TaxID=3125778 RepID=UPI003CEF0DAC